MTEDELRAVRRDAAALLEGMLTVVQASGDPESAGSAMVYGVADFLTSRLSTEDIAVLLGGTSEAP